MYVWMIYMYQKKLPWSWSQVCLHTLGAWVHSLSVYLVAPQVMLATLMFLTPLLLGGKGTWVFDPYVGNRLAAMEKDTCFTACSPGHSLGCSPKSHKERERERKRCDHFLPGSSSSTFPIPQYLVSAESDAFLRSRGQYFLNQQHLHLHIYSSKAGAEV